MSQSEEGKPSPEELEAFRQALSGLGAAIRGAVMALMPLMGAVAQAVAQAMEERKAPRTVLSLEELRDAVSDGAETLPVKVRFSAEGGWRVEPSAN